MFPNKEHILYINITKNNTIMTLTDFKGQAIAWQTSGSSGFSGSRKKGKFASIEACLNLCEKIKDFNINELNIVFRGQFNRWKLPLIFTILESGLEIIAMLDNTPIPHGGCRKKRPKR